MISPQHSRIPLPPRPADSQQSNDKRVILIRARLFAVFIGMLFLALIGRLWFLQIVHGDEYKEKAAANEARTIRSIAPRGTIVDINGRIMATNRSRYAVYATPEVLKNDIVLTRLSKILGETPDDIKQSMSDSQQNPYDPIRVALDIPMTVVTQIEENRPYLPGVSTEPEPVRWYPYGKLGAHLLGTMGRITETEFKDKKFANYYRDDFVGKTGVEKEYEKFLHGMPGGTQVQVDAKGRKLRTLGTIDATPGNTVVLTIDSKVQEAAEKVFAERKFTGAAVAINPQTGAVLAMVSEPGYYPDKFATGIKSEDWKPLNSDKNHPLINRTLDAMYPPGSTFKPIVAAAGLQTGAITTHSTAYCPGSYHLGRARFGCWQRHNGVDFFSAVAKSCDVFFYIAGQNIGPERMSTYAKNFGLAEKTGIDMPEEDIGSIPSPTWKQHKYGRLGPEYSQWYGGDTLHMSIGQGYVLTTPLQMARVTATIANGGNVMKPYIVDHAINPETSNIIPINTPQVIRHVNVSPQNMEEVRKAMRFTVTHGTGRIVDLPGITAAGKTGSAQTHGNVKTHGWFICFAPYDKPTIAIASIVEHGGHGADTAGRVAKAMLQAYFHIKADATVSVKSD